MPTKKELLTTPIHHIDIKQHNVVPLVDAMQSMAYSSRDLARAASIYERMLRDQDCGVILPRGSLISAGSKQILWISSATTWWMPWSQPARHGRPGLLRGAGVQALDRRRPLPQGTEDATLRELMIDRIYDTLIDEEELRACDDTCRIIADSLDPPLQLA